MANEFDKEENLRLLASRSPYLRSAAHQPVQWYPWCDEAFQKAQAEDKPILLDIGAIWCHWCHVIDRESYENPEVAGLINQYFVPIKVDRDERPDVDTRYQHAVMALTGQGGWPLTAFLTPKGEIFFGGTYFPPDDRLGRLGMKNLLSTMAKFYSEKKEDVFSEARKISQTLSSATEKTFQEGDLSSSIRDRILLNILQEYDPDFGGFSVSPKFPAQGALELLLEEYAKTNNEKFLTMVKTTLEGMAQGGIRDQLTGAFHRYSLDQYWRVPHFEIMLYVNAGLLQNYSHAYQVTQNPLFKEVALGILQYMNEEFSDQRYGGFFGSQDADNSADDDGDYYTWTLEEAGKVLDPVTLEIVKRYYDIGERGEMQENPKKNVLFIADTPESIAKSLGIPLDEVKMKIEQARMLLKKERAQRNKPLVDQNIYVQWNAMMASSYLDAFKAFGLEEAKKFALKTLDFLWEHAHEEGQGMLHFYSEGKSRLKGLLEDQIQMAQACLDAYEVVGDSKYRTRAIELIRYCLENFWDETHGAFFDSIPDSNAQGLLKLPYKNFEDSPSPSANAVAAMVLDRLYYMTGEKSYREYAEKTLEVFAETAPRYGYFVAAYARALDFHLEEPPKVVLVGDKNDSQFRYLLWAAHEVYRPGKIVIPLELDEIRDPALSENLRILLESQESENLPLSFVCAGQMCASPTNKIEDLKKIIRCFGIKKK